MVRPMIAPMAEAAAQREHPGILPATLAKIRAHAAASENWGNFFADDVVVAIGPVLLMHGILVGAGIPVSVWEIGIWGLPTACAGLAAGWWRGRVLDRAIRQARGARAKA